MRKISLLVMVITILVFSGCATRATPSTAATIAQWYDTTKTIYVKGKEIVIINSDLLDDKTLHVLNEVDERATQVDAVKGVVDGNVSNELILKAIDSDAQERYFKTTEVIER